MWWGFMTIMHIHQNFSGATHMQPPYLGVLQSLQTLPKPQMKHQGCPLMCLGESARYSVGLKWTGMPFLLSALMVVA